MKSIFTWEKRPTPGSLIFVCKVDHEVMNKSIKVRQTNTLGAGKYWVLTWYPLHGNNFRRVGELVRRLAYTPPSEDLSLVLSIHTGCFTTAGSSSPRGSHAPGLYPPTGTHVQTQARTHARTIKHKTNF